jgi:soluble lytic murein transglycosylase-like protein
MKYKKANRIVQLTGIISAAALSLTSKSIYDISKDRIYDTMAPSISLVKSTVISNLPYYNDILDNTADSIAAIKKDYNTLDSLLNEARTALRVPLVYTNAYMDAVVNPAIDTLVNHAINRPTINQEALVSSILDTVSNYTEAVDKYFVKASIREESRYDPNIKSEMHAMGLGQFTRSTWKNFGEGPFLPNVYNPVKNIRATIKYYTWMEEEFSKYNPKWSSLTIPEKRDLLAAGFNGGPYRLMDKKYNVNWDLKKMPKQSRDHIIKINTAMEELRQEDLFRNIAFYRERIGKYELAVSNTYWTAFSALPQALSVSKS